MKTATLNVKMSQQLYDKIKEDATSYKVTMAEYVRALLARQSFGSQKQHVLGQDAILVDSDGAWIFDYNEDKSAKPQVDSRQVQHGLFAKNIYEGLLFNLDEAVAILSNTKPPIPIDASALPPDIEYIPAKYATQLDGIHYRAQAMAEPFFEPFAKWVKNRRKEIEATGERIHAERFAERDWYVAAAAKLRTLLVENKATQFWGEQYTQYFAGQNKTKNVE
jgi:hypothetical protein